jgi:hypothetical protein
MEGRRKREILGRRGEEGLVERAGQFRERRCGVEETFVLLGEGREKAGGNSRRDGELMCDLGCERGR